MIICTCSLLWLNPNIYYWPDLKASDARSVCLCPNSLFKLCPIALIVRPWKVTSRRWVLFETLYRLRFTMIMNIIFHSISNSTYVDGCHISTKFVCTHLFDKIIVVVISLLHWLFIVSIYYLIGIRNNLNVSYHEYLHLDI